MNEKKIVIINYGAGNIYSVFKLIKKLNSNTIVSNEYNQILESNCIILPGVGSFFNAIKYLKDKKLFNLIKKKSDQNCQIIGICLGMQLMFSYGNEDGYSEGFNFFKGESYKIKEKKYCKIPNVGLRDIKLNVQLKEKTFHEFKNEKFYHLHSYMVKTNKKNIVAWSNREDKKYTIPAIVKRKNIIGFQFHPEKSGPPGIKLFKKILTNL